jgi:hypothetical protein
MDQAIDYVLDRTGDVHQVALLGDYANGIDSGTIEILIMGEDIDSAYLLQLSGKTEKLLGKDIKIYLEKPKQVNGQIILYQKEN